jgi:dihydroorotate dehydrogenase (fumarate)
MRNLTTNYMGLKLKNPVIIGSSGLTSSVEMIKNLAANNAGAVVLKSLFEEQILAEMNASSNHDHHDYPEGYDYARFYTKEKNLSDYLNLIKDAKAAVDIPIIASINCIDDAEWMSFAKKIEEAGADALELNIAILPSNPAVSAEENEQLYFSILEKVRAEISIPIALKMSHYSAHLAHLIQQLSYTKNLDSFVLFNRYYNPDIDIENMEIGSSSTFSSPDDIAVSLRWVALLSDIVQKELVASTGVHDGAGVIKQLLAGAQAVQMTSAIYIHGAEYINTVLKDIEAWMERKSFNSIEDFRSKLSLKQLKNPAIFERTQFMKYYANKK